MSEDTGYYLGIDIGTTSVKAVAFSDGGEVLAKQAVGYEMHHPQEGWSEQDPVEVRRAVEAGINAVVKAMAPARPRLLSFSAAMHSLLAVDEKGTPLTSCIIWADNRAAAIADSLRDTDIGRHCYQVTGVPVHAMSPFCKLLWLKAHEPGIFNAAHKFVGIKEYLFYHWFGRWVVDTSVASATGLLNIRSLQWEKALLDFVAITADRLPEPVPVKQAFYYTAAHGREISGEQATAPAKENALPLHDQTPFIIGSSDGALANLATCSCDDRALVVTVGTSAAARILARRVETDPFMRTFCYHAKDDCYIIGGAGNNGGVVLQWLKETLLQTGDSFQQLFEKAARAPAGSDGLLFLPYLLGERAPLWNADAKGVFFGLTIRHNQSHLVRAAMEGIIYALYSIGRVIMENNDPDVVYANGGFAQSPLWLQVLADVFNKKVLVYDPVESAALGAALVGMEALQVKPAIDKQSLKEYMPDPDTHIIYARLFTKFERLYDLLKKEFTNTHSLA